jgi:hypothetical protein
MTFSMQNDLKHVKNYLKIVLDLNSSVNNVIHKVNGQFQHNRASNAKLGMKFYKMK